MIRGFSSVIWLSAALIPLALVAAPGPAAQASRQPASAGRGVTASPGSTPSPGSGRPSQSPVNSDTGPAGPSAGPGSASSPPYLQYSPELEWPLVIFHASQLWKHSLGAGVTVAVVDTGIDLRQPDLTGAVFPILDLTARESRDYGADESRDSHGTAVAGIIAARGSAGQAGMVGLAPQASLLDIRVAVQPDRVSAAAVAQGIISAAQAGAAIINVSLIVPAVSQKLGAAVSYAQARHCLIVAAAGNAAAPQALASYPEVLTVAAVNRAGQPDTTLAAGGPATLSAPGIGLISTGETEGAGATGYGFVRDISGSGFSAAYVTAAAALLLSADPKLSPAAAAQLVTETAERAQDHPVPAIDPLAALDALLHPPSTRPSGGDQSAVTEAIALGVVGVVIVILLARILAVRRRHAARLALGAIPPSSWDQPW